MDLAVDSYTEQLIAACEVGRYRGDYQCPCCSYPVYFAKGQFQRAHFRHNPNHDARECELRVASFVGVIGRSLIEASRRKKRLLLPGIQVEETGGRLIWLPYVRYQPRDFDESISVGNPPVEHRVWNSKKPMFVGLDSLPETTRISIKSSSGSSLSREAPLFPAGTKVFARNGAFFGLVNESDPLSAGDYYALLEEGKLDAMPEELAFERGTTAYGHELWKLTIPDYPSEAAIQFIRDALDREIYIADYTCSLLTDAYCENNESNFWELPPESHVGLLIRRRSTRTVRTRTLNVQSLRKDVGRAVSENHQSNQEWTVLDMGVLPPGRYIVGCEETQEIIILLEVEPDFELPSGDGLRFDFNNQDGSIKSHFWSSRDLAQALLATPKDLSNLADVNIPFGVKLSGVSGDHRTVLKSAREVVDFVRRHPTSGVLEANGFSKIRLTSGKISTNREKSTAKSLKAPRTRHEHRLRQGFLRGYVPSRAVNV